MIKYKFTNNYNYKGKIYKRGEFFEVDKLDKKAVSDLRVLLGAKMVIALKQEEGKEQLRPLTQLEEGKDALEIKRVLTSKENFNINVKEKLTNIFTSKGKGKGKGKGAK